MTLLAQLFGDDFLTASWPDRARHTHGPVERIAGIGESWLARFVDELSLQFVAHACEHYRAQVPRPGHREHFIVQQLGRVEYALAGETVVLQPGGALFAPRDVAIAPRVLDDDATAHVFAFMIPSWLEMLGATAIAELGKDVAWRGRVVPDDETFRAAIEPVIAQLRALRPPRR